VKNKPPYAIESVDNALRILQLIRDSGQVRVSDMAAELGIARSTAHRLLAMLVYRDFAVRTEDRCYRPGPALSARPLAGEPAQRLRQALRPHMEDLRDQVNETINLVVRLGPQTRFLHTVESTQLLRVGDRQGTILPAWQTSGGKALLASLDDQSLAAYLKTARLEALTDRTITSKPALQAEIEAGRARGWFANRGESLDEVTTISASFRWNASVYIVTVAGPSSRLDRKFDQAAAMIASVRQLLEMRANGK